MRALALLLLCSMVCGSIYVTQNGEDNLSCGDESSPCETLSQAVLLGCQSESETIMVEPGEYQSPIQSINCSLSIRSTQGASQTTLRENSAGGGIVVQGAVNFTIDGFTIAINSHASSWFNCSSVANHVVVSNIRIDSGVTTPLVVSESQYLYLKNISLSNINTTRSFIIAAHVDHVVATGFTVANCTGTSLIEITQIEATFHASHWVVRDSTLVPFFIPQTIVLLSMEFYNCKMDPIAWEIVNSTIRDCVWSDLSLPSLSLTTTGQMEFENVIFGPFIGENSLLQISSIGEFPGIVNNCSFYNIPWMNASNITLSNSIMANVLYRSTAGDVKMTNVTITDSSIRCLETQELLLESCRYVRSNILVTTQAVEDYVFRFHQGQISMSSFEFGWAVSQTPPSNSRVLFDELSIQDGVINSRFDLEFRDCTIEQSASLAYSSDLLFTRTVINNCTLTTTYLEWIYHTTPTVVFSNSTVINCPVGSYETMISFPRVVLQQSTFQGNQVGAYGALIRMGETLTMDNCTFADNLGDHGSVLVRMTGNAQSNHTDIVYNNNNFGDAGLVQATETVTLILKHNNFQGNEGMNLIRCGGSSTCHFEDCQFLNNNSTAIAFDGDSSAYLHQTRFINNSALQGGAIASGGSAQARCEGCVFESNHAYAGGAIFGRDLSRIFLINSTFESNRATSSGGACNLGNQGVTVIVSSIFQNNRAKTGGAISCEQCNVAVNTTIFVSNSVSEYGGAVAFSSAGVGFVVESIFAQNLASEYGGVGFTSGSASVELLRCNMTGNGATYGGGLYVSDSSHVTLSGGLMHENEAKQYGGAIYQANPTRLDIANLSITSNSALAGGAIFAEFPQLNISSSLISSNNASGWGGALMLTMTSDSLISISLTTFSYNQGTQGGAIGITSDQSEVVSYITFLGCQFQHNRALAGGAISSILARSVLFDDSAASEFVNNTAKVYGGAVCFKQVNIGHSILNNVSFIDNTAMVAGGAVMVEDLGGKAPSNGSQVPYALCKGCSYSGNTSPGYQTEDGWASNPSQLVMTGNPPCGMQYQLDTVLPPFEVTVEDSFGTPVQGELLKRVPFDVKASYVGSGTYPSAGFLQIPMDTDTGKVTFDPFDFCALSGSTVSISAQAINDTSRIFNRFDIQPITSCSFSIGGCSQSGYEPQPDPQNDLCEVCQPVSLFDWKTLTLILSSLFLCSLLLLVIGGLVACKFYRRMKYRIYEAMEIPDIVGNSVALSLNEVIQNSTVRVLEWKDLSIGEPLGRGAFGVVSRGTYQGEPVAIKELILGIDEHHTEEFTDFLKEIVVMSSLKDKNIVAFVGVAVPPDQSRLCLVTELMERGSVHDLMAKKGENISRKMRFHLAAGAALGIAHLHVKNLIHRDLKTDNLLVDQAWTCKVADFGISTLFQETERRRTCIGTPTYMAPEVLSRENYTHKADVFSFGVVLYEMFSGMRAYSDPEHAAMSVAVLNDAILQGARPDTSAMEESLQILIERCWAHDPKERPNFRQIHTELERLGN